ncbi:hypothetical protein [Streptomyces sp. SID3343]|uniref:hypothetical protein n=1 Tax=Streptomyces sp. SID3343 TaxID=2690260 RepID=UPI00136D4F66|nr:hypothetical protein [Streptomyces sp. SID3343]MYV97294.1 hypothetical protein [Streptomyces sp. SID3343]
MASAAELVDRASTVINRDPARAPTPGVGPTMILAATTRTTTPTTPQATTPARQDPFEPRSRHTR